jgi:hypothetical protein
MRRNAAFVAKIVALVDDVPPHGQAQVLNAVRRAVAGVVIRRPPSQRVVDDTASQTLAPRSRGDVRWAAAGRDFPTVQLASGRAVSGEREWLEILDEADESLLRELHAALRGSAADDVDDDGPELD